MSNRRRRDPYRLVGTHLDRYLLEDLVGIGGMGVVYRAQHTLIESTVAVKILKPDMAIANPELNSLFIEEARKTAWLDHPGITRVTDANVDADIAFLVMEWLEGRTLEQVLKENQVLSLDQIVPLLEQICDALAYAHGRGIVHRDLKPGNIMVVGDFKDDERVKIMDFGIAKVFDSTQAINSRIMGSPYYASPEQLTLGTNIDHRADIYSLGVTLYQLITGQLPFSSESIDSLISEHLTTTPPPISKIRPDVNKAVEEVILRALAKKPYDRYESILELSVAFRRASETHSRSVAKKLKGVLGDRTTNDRATISKLQRDSLSVTRLRKENSPTGFFDVSIFSRSRFFEGERVRYTKIEETLTFYRNHLQQEYEALLKQVNLANNLWLACVLFGFLTFATGLITLFLNKIAAGALTTASAGLVYFIQRIFHQREEYYRVLASTKYKHLEFGNEWLLIIQSIDAIEEPKEKMKQQAKLVEALTEKMRNSLKKDTT